MERKRFLEQNMKGITIKEKKRKERLKDYCVRYLEGGNDSKT